MASVGIRGVGATVALLQNALLARAAGAGGLGIYFVVQAWSRVGGAATALGLPPFVLRRSAALRHCGRVADADRLVQRSRRLTTGVSVVAVSAALLVLATLYGRGAIGWTTFAVGTSAAIGAAAFASTRLLADALKARGEPELALTVEFSLPGLLLCAILVIVLAPGAHLSVGAMLLATTATATAAPVVGWMWWDRRASTTSERRSRTTGTSGRPHPVDVPSAELAPRSLVQLTMLGGLNIVLWAQPTLILAFLVDDAEVGRFGVAQRVVAVASLNIVALGSHFSSRFAAAEARRDRAQLQLEVRRARTLTFVSYLPFFAAFVVWPGSVLRLFGGGFEEAAPLLVIMAFGQLVNAATGLCSETLLMTGHERWEIVSTAVGVLTMLVVAPMAGAAFGAVGVAAACAGAMALRNTLSSLLVRRVTRASEVPGYRVLVRAAP